MSKSLVAFFSASGCTERVARNLAGITGSDLFEIKPAIPYTAPDLDWQDQESRSTWEMQHKDYRPAIQEPAPDLTDYDTIYLGFPIWWYVAPTIVNTFLESGDFSGKTIVPFATSGGSGLGNAVQELQPSAPGACFAKGKRFPISAGKKTLEEFSHEH